MKFRDETHDFEDDAVPVKRNQKLQWPGSFDVYKLVKSGLYAFTIHDSENDVAVILESSKTLKGLNLEVNWLDAKLIDVLCRNERFGMTYNVRNAIPCPESRKFEVGTMINLGKVIAHLDDFSIYYIEQTNLKNETVYVCRHWHSVFSVESEDRGSNFKANENPFRRIRYYSTSISSLYSKFFRFGIDFNPSYQRQSCWTLEQKQNLIDSLFAGLPIGAIVLAERDWAKDNQITGDMEEVVDGKQRLLAILDYICDKFPYRGYFYSELSASDRWSFDEAQIMIGEIKTVDHYDLGLVLDVFIRLNAGGTSMEPQELDKAREMIKKL